MTWLRHKRAIDSIGQARVELDKAERVLADPPNPSRQRVADDLEEARGRVAMLTAIAELYERKGRRA